MAPKATLFTIKQTNTNSDQQQSGDAIVLFLTEKQMQNDSWIHPKLDTHIQMLNEKKVFQAKPNEYEVFPAHDLIPYTYVVLVGLGDGSTSIHRFREAAAATARVSIKLKLQTLVVPFQPEFNNESDVIYALTEGFLLGSYHRKSYQHEQVAIENERVRQITYFTSAGQADLTGLEKAIHAAEAYADATNFARDLTNLPGNDLIPEKLADVAVKMAKRYGFECDILDEQEIIARNMGGLYAVGKGSVNPPRMIALKYQGLEEWKDVIGLVGKGITFDTGGISLKKSEGMEEMISDMGGAATVIGVMEAVGRIRPKLNLLAVIPAAENMPSGSAFKPGDIITTMSGRTIEVLNADAEGRVVLADGIAYAKKLGATKLIDVATLTGAVLVCLGDVATGAVTNDDNFMKRMIEASGRSGEKVWQLPAYPEYWEMVKSDVADVRNLTSPGRWAGAITGGLFIGVFADETPWIHLDIGGTAWLEKQRGVDPKGGTGVMVRTLLHMICPPDLSSAKLNVT